MSTTTDKYSPFQQELLNHLCQINTNVNSLIEVFINLQSQLTLTNAKSESINSNPNPNSNSNSNSNTNININSNSISPIESPKIIQSKSESMIIIKEEEEKTKNKNENNECKTEDIIPLSLDSSDTDDEETNNNNDESQNASNYFLSNKYKHRNRFGYNRSKSTSQSASMTTLLRANHIRNHKFNGILNKYKKKSYDQKSDSYINTNNKKNKPKHKSKKKNIGPKFNPEHVFLSKNNRTIINVGGSLYETTLNTLSADQSSMLSAMFSGRFKIERDENGSIFIDRDPTHFRHILNFLRDGIEYLKHGGLLQQPDAIVNELLQEAKYYNIRPLVDYIQLQQTRKNKKNGDELTHEKQYKLVCNIGIDQFEDVFNKYTGSAGYDFEQWLFVSPYKTSRNSTSLPTFIMLFSKKLSRAEVRLLDRLTNIDFQ